jgi:hypothetical protein
MQNRRQSKNLLPLRLLDIGLDTVALCGGEETPGDQYLDYLCLTMKIQIWNSPKCLLTPRILIWKTGGSKLLHDAAIF